MNAPVHYPWLDVARGVSALLVVVGHCRAAFFPPLSTIASPSIIEIGFYAATSLGHQAVMAFFVLSGFLVGGSVIRAGQRFRFRDYLIARLCRLWVVLIPALMFTWAVDVVIAMTAPHALHGAFSAQWNSGPHTDVPYSRSLTTFLGNIAFVQTAWVPVFGTNGPVWSLFCEFWYYVIFPLLMMGFAPRSRFALPFAAVVAFCVAYFLSLGMLLGFAVWLMGVLAFVASASLRRPVPRVWIALSCLMLLLAMGYSKGLRARALLGIHPDLVIGFAFAVFVFCVAKVDAATTVVGLLRWVLRAGHALSNISYSLYLCHFPILVLISATFFPESLGRLGLYSGAIYALVVAFLCLVGIVFWLLFERHTDKVRDWVRLRLGMMLFQASPRN